MGSFFLNSVWPQCMAEYANFYRANTARVAILCVLMADLSTRNLVDLSADFLIELRTDSGPNFSGSVHLESKRLQRLTVACQTDCQSNHALID